MFENLTPLIPLSVLRRGGDRARRPAVAVRRGWGRSASFVSYVRLNNYARGYWLTRCLEEKQPGLLKGLLTGHFGQTP